MTYTQEDFERDAAEIRHCAETRSTGYDSCCVRLVDRIIAAYRELTELLHDRETDLAFEYEKRVAAEAENERLRTQPEIHGTLKNGTLVVTTPLSVTVDNPGVLYDTDVVPSLMAGTIADRDHWKARAEAAERVLDAWEAATR